MDQQIRALLQQLENFQQTGTAGEAPRLLAEAARLLRECLEQGPPSQRRAEEALRESEQRLALALQAMQDGIWDWSPVTREYVWSDRLTAMLGYAPGEITPSVENFNRMLHPDDVARTWEAVQACLESRESHYQIEFRMRHKDGSYRWMLSRGVAVYGPDGSPARMVGSHTDITALKESQAALEKMADKVSRQSRLFEQIAWTTPDFIYVFDRQGRFLYANRRLLEVWGRTFDEAVGRSLYELGYPKWHADMHMRELDEVIRTRQAIKGEVPFTGGSGISGVYEYIFTPVLGPDGEVEVIAGTTRDVTARREAETALQRSGERWALLAQTAGELLVSRDPQAVVDKLCRRVMEHLDCQVFFNFLVDETGRRLKLNACHGISEVEMSAASELALGQAVCGCVARDGCRIVAEQIDVGDDPRTALVKSFGVRAYACHPLHGAQGQVIGTLSFGTKNRDRFTAGELELMKAVADQVAVAMVRQRGEADLRAAKQAAELANSAKDHFLAMLSHELRTPLTPVLATAQMMDADPALPAAYRDMAQIVRRNVELEARLIDDLLDLTRIARNKLQLHVGDVDVHEKIRHVRSMCGEEIAARQLAVSLSLNAVNHHVQADPARFQQILWNLLKNATKFTRPGGKISIGTWNDRDGRIGIEVADDGVGIAAEALPRIFDAFEQGEREVTRQYGGLGLGLAISRALVEMHGGTIAAHSGGRDQGARITVLLPVRKGGQGAAGGASARSGEALTCSILLVEDHADTRRIMTRLLQSMGCRVESAGTLAEALEKAASGTFDLLVSDIGLPDGSGTDLMRQVKARHRLKGIALSGFGMEEDVIRSREAGFEAHLTKPVNLEALEEAIRRLTVA